MLGKAWSAVLLLIVMVVALDLIKIAVTPYLPIIGLMVLVAIGFALYRLYRLLQSKRDHW